MHCRAGGRLASSKQNTLRKIPDLRSSSGSPEASMSTSSGPSRMEHEVQPQPQPQNVDRPTLLSLQEEEEDARPSYQEVDRNNPRVSSWCYSLCPCEWPVANRLFILPFTVC
jgi:hypothetical protein